MASSSHNRDDGYFNIFTGRGRAFEHVHEEDEHVDFSGDDGDDDDDLNDAPLSMAPRAATDGELYYPGVTTCIVSASVLIS